MRRLEKHDSQFQQQMAPFQAAVTGKTQNRCPSDVASRSHGSPLDKEETSNHHVIFAEEQQPDSTTRPDIRLKEIAAAASTSTTAGVEHHARVASAQGTASLLLVGQYNDEIHTYKYLDKGPKCSQINHL